MHLKRWLTALCLLPVIVYIIGFCSSYVFYVSVCIVMLLALNEFYKIDKNISFIFKFIAYCLSLFIVLLIVKGSMYLFPFGISCSIFLPLFMIIAGNYSPEKALFQNIAKLIFGIIYIALPFCMLIIIHKHPYGRIWIFFLLCLIIMGDTGAFYFGKYLGKHSLHKKISPNKTWEGAIGGLFCSTMSGIFFIKVFKLMPLSARSVIFIILLGIIGQLGDLAESFIKRSYNVKDSGKILPGHGGILDRIDSLLFTIPFIYAYMVL